MKILFGKLLSCVLCVTAEPQAFNDYEGQYNSTRRPVIRSSPDEHKEVCYVILLRLYTNSGKASAKIPYRAHSDYIREPIRYILRSIQTIDKLIDLDEVWAGFDNGSFGNLRTINRIH